MGLKVTTKVPDSPGARCKLPVLQLSLPLAPGLSTRQKSVCFVLDTSDSMKLNMKVRPDDLERLGDLPADGTRSEIARAALLHALEEFLAHVAEKAIGQPIADEENMESPIS